MHSVLKPIGVESKYLDFSNFYSTVLIGSLMWGKTPHFHIRLDKKFLLTTPPPSLSTHYYKNTETSCAPREALCLSFNGKEKKPLSRCKLAIVKDLHVNLFSICSSLSHRLFLLPICHSLNASQFIVESFGAG